MRRLVLALAVIAAAGLLFPPAAVAQKEVSHARIVRLSLVEGDVQIARPEEEGWEQAIANMPIQQGYALSSGRGRAEIEFESGATVRISDYTSLQFTDLSLADGNRITRLTLSHGTAIIYASLSRGDSFVMLTPGVQVTIPRNARVRMDVAEERVDVAVLRGEVSIEGPSGTYRLEKNQAMVFKGADAADVEIIRAPNPDEFERWAADRDEVIASSRSASLRYVNASFRYGVHDLGNYGNWIYVVPYGYVWQPYGVALTWAPYYHGRWVWVAGFGWSWVSYEPWGWVPYHYGRWAYVSVGWVWVPSYFTRWHPGHVVWVQIGSNWGWCALGPFDRWGRRHHNFGHGIVVSTSTAIVTGGRHGRPGVRDVQPRVVDRPDRPDQFGPRPRPSIAGRNPDLPDVRGERGGRNFADDNDARGRAPQGLGSRTGLDRSDRPGRPVEVNSDDIVRRTGDVRSDAVDRRGEARSDTRTDATDRSPRSRGYGGAGLPPQADSDRDTRGRGRPAQTGGPIEYDPDSRTFTNKPPRPPIGVERVGGDDTPRSGNTDPSRSGSAATGGDSRRPDTPDRTGRADSDRPVRSYDSPRSTDAPRNDLPRSYGSRADVDRSDRATPRNDTPRYTPPPSAPRSEASRPAPSYSPRYDSRPSTPPPASTPRYESRPSTPPPSSPRYESRPSAPSSPRMDSRPSTPPPAPPRGGNSRPGSGRPDR
jgi:hypothetical protein